MYKIGLYVTYIGYISRLMILVVLGYILRESVLAFLNLKILEGFAYLIYACVGGSVVYVIGNIIIGIGVAISQRAIKDELD